MRCPTKSPNRTNMKILYAEFDLVVHEFHWKVLFVKQVLIAINIRHATKATHIERLLKN